MTTPGPHWIHSLKVGDQVYQPHWNQILTVDKITPGRILIKGPGGADIEVRLRDGRLVGHIPNIEPATAETAKLIRARERARAREEMNNEIRELARRLSTKRALQLIAFAKTLR